MSPTARAGLAAAVFLAAFVAVLKSGLFDSEGFEVFSDLTSVALGLVYVPLALRTARSAQGRLKAAWLAMTIGFACWLLGEMLWAFFELVADEPPSPSWADLAYLAYYPWVCVALLLFPAARSWRSQAQLILDAVIVTGSFFLISWLTGLRSIWQNGAVGNLGFVVSVAYPVGDVLVMTLGLLVLIRAAPGLRLTLTLLVAGLMVASLADSLWVYDSDTAGESVGGLVDVLYVANALLIIVALVAGYRARPGDPGAAAPPGWLPRSLPLLPLAVAALLVAPADPAVVMESPVAVTGLLLIVSLVVRQILEAAELAKRERQVRKMADRESEELHSAVKYVLSVLPGDLDGPVQVRSRYLPSREIGGDSFGYLWIDDDHLIVYLIDVSGHGVEPALLSLSVHNMVRSRAMPVETLQQPDRVMAELNHRVGMDRDDQYFTMWYGVYQESTRVLRYATAGYPPALALTGERGAVRATPLGGSAVPIGMFSDSEYSVETYDVPAGAQILLYSNGVLGDRLSLAGLTEICEEVAARPGWSPGSLIARLRATSEGTFEDDCALIQLTFSTAPDAASRLPVARPEQSPCPVDQ